MDKNKENKSAGLNGLTAESKMELLRRIWNGTSDQMCLAKMVFDDHGAPVDYIILDINPAYEKANGFARDHAINKRVTELFPYYNPEWIEKCGEAVRLGKNFISVEHINEPCLWYKVQVFPLGSEDQFITMTRDTTRQNEEKTRNENDIVSNETAKEALIERAELMNVLMDNNPSLIFLKDECGRYVYLNRTYEQQFIGSGNWYGKTDFDFWPKESAEFFRANDLAVLETGRVTQYLEDSKDLEGTRYCWLNYKFPYTDQKSRRYTGGIGIDVTKRIITEEALRKAEEELRRYAEELKRKEEETLELIDSFTEGSWIVDRLAGTIKCAEKWAKRIGLDQVPEEERLSFVRTLSHPDDTAGGNSIPYYIESGATEFDLEYRIKTVDSGYIWTQHRGKIVYNEEGQAVKVYAATFDISQRKQAEEKLRDAAQLIEYQNRKLNAVIQSLPHGLVIYDKNANPIFYNEQSLKSYNKAIENKDIPMAHRVQAMRPMHKEGGSAATEEMPIMRALKGEEVRDLEMSYISRFGERLWVSSTTAPIINGDGEINGAVATYVDITERKRVEEALRDSEQRLRLATQAAGMYTWELDVSTGGIRFSGDVKGVIGFSYTEYDDVFSRIGRYTVPEDGERHKEALLRTMRGEGDLHSVNRVISPDTGEIVWLETHATLVGADSGTPQRVVGIACNITERKKAEEALRESEMRYRELVKYAAAGIYEVDFRSNRFTEVNDAMCQILGYSKEELLKMSPFDILDNKSQITFQTRLNQWLSGERPDQNVDYIVKTKKGREIYASLNVSFKRDENGKPLGATVIAHDITKRKKAEEALRESEEKYRAIVENAGEGISITSTDGLTTFVNQRMADMLGYDVDEMLGRPGSDFVSTDWEHRVHGATVEVCESDVLKGEFKLRRKDGSPLWTYYSAVRMFNEKGEHVANMELHTDITERKQTEEALRESQETLESFYNSSPFMMGVAELRDNVIIAVYGNEAVGDFFGQPQDQLPGHTGSELGTQEEVDRLWIENYRRSQREGTPVRFEYEHLSHHGLVWLCATVSYIGQGFNGLPRFSFVAEEITERKHAEEVLQNERQRFFDVLETLPVMICLITPDYHIPFANKAFREKFGEAEGRCCYDYCCGYTQPCSFCESLLPLATGQPHHWEFTSPDGNTIIDAYDFLFTDIDGSPLILEMDIDITERKQAEEALRKSEEKARALVVELEKADKNKNTFLNMLSHELRNPLASIMMSLSLLDRVSSDGEQALRAREIALRQGEQLTRLIDDLLDITRITQNKIILKKDNIELNQLVQKAAADYQGQFAEKVVALEIKLTPAPIYLEADPARLTQIISNLLHNAAKFTAQGDKTMVTVAKDKKTSEAVIIIQDTGIGIKPELLPDLFEPFVQVDSSLARTHGGLGLGLAIVKGMVELHGGSVTAQSEGLGCGTQFYIRLPVKSTVEVKQEDNPKGITAHSFKILVIDDIPDIAEILYSLLSYLGHEVLIAFSGPEGLVKAKEFKPEVVICDIGLPGMTGYEVAKSLRSDQELKDTFLIALSGYAQPEDLDRSREAGFDTHLAKPVNLDTLEQVLADVILNHY